VHVSYTVSFPLLSQDAYSHSHALFTIYHLESLLLRFTLLHSHQRFRPYHRTPPFSPSILADIARLSSLPSLINTSQLLAGVDPAALAAFLAANAYTNTNNSQPNPIAKTFPNAATGTINGTLAVLPIDFEMAREIIPRQYGILRESIRELLPMFPEDKYPVRYLPLALFLPHNRRP